MPFVPSDGCRTCGLGKGGGGVGSWSRSPTSPPSWSPAALPPRRPLPSGNLLRRCRERFRTWTLVACRRRGGNRGRWRTNLPHGLQQVRNLPGDVDVMLAHPRRGMAEEFGQRLDVHAVQDRPRAERMAQPIQFRVLRDTRLLPRPLHSQRQVAAVPRRAAVRAEHPRPRLLPLADRGQAGPPPPASMG